MKIDDRPTPMTDARVTVCAECGPMMDVDFARRLERERDALREALEPFANEYEIAEESGELQHWPSDEIARCKAAYEAVAALEK